MSSEVIGIFFPLVTQYRFLQLHTPVTPDGLRVGLGQNLEPQARRRIRAHRDNGTLGKENRLAETVNVLPVRIPVGNLEEPPALAAREHRIRLDRARRWTWLGIDRENIGIKRKLKIVACAHLDEHREFFLRLVCEVQRNLGFHLLGSTCRMQRGAQDQIVARIETPGEAFRLDVRNLAGFPEQKTSLVGFIERALYPGIAAGEPLTGRDLLTALRTHTIHIDAHETNRAGVAGVDIDRPNVARFRDRYRNDEIPDNIRTGGRQTVGALRL